MQHMIPKNWCQICTLLLIEHIKTSVYILSKKNKHRKLEDVLEGKKSASRNRFGLSMLAPKDMVKPSRIAQADPAHGGCKKRGYSGDDLIQRFVQTLLLILARISKKVATKWRKFSEKRHHNIIKYPQTASFLE